MAGDTSVETTFHSVEARRFDDKEYYWIGYPTPCGFREIAKLSFGYSGPAEQEQHDFARLFAIAPDLLAALKEAAQDCSCSVIERSSGHRVECRVPGWVELVDKAEGRS